MNTPNSFHYIILIDNEEWLKWSCDTMKRIEYLKISEIIYFCDVHEESMPSVQIRCKHGISVRVEGLTSIQLETMLNRD